MKRNIKLTLQYDGKNFCGWQRQASVRTAEGVLKKAAEELFSQPIQLKSASRLDKGAHALNQVVNFYVETSIPIQNIPYALNSLLPDDIIVNKAEEVPPTFHARYSAKSRTYIYKIYNDGTPSVFLRYYALWNPHPLKIDKMQEAASLFIGRHDFSTILHRKQKAERTIFESYFYKEDKMLIYRVKANAFLPHMIRCMVALLLAVGEGRFPPSRIASILSGERVNFSPVGAEGLYLFSVEYED